MISETVEIAPAAGIRGQAQVSGDKSISHRLAMIGGVARGITTIRNFAQSADCHSTLECLRGLGVKLEKSGSTVTIEGRGFDGLQVPRAVLDAGNSGTTVRLMAGLLASRPFEATFTGDASLSRRPMRRIIEPLTLFGATLSAREGNYLPLKIHGGRLTALDYTLPVASAQVKSAALFAGLQAQGITRVHEPAPSRNHTELALAQFGAHVRSNGGTVEIEGGAALEGGAFTVPGDLSSAAFLIAAAAGLPGSQLEMTGIGVNPTRSGFIELLQRMGARIEVSPHSTNGGEAVADIRVEGAELSGSEIAGAWIPNVIDEIPVLAVLATRTRNGIRIRDASELRAKESDRIRAVASNLAALGVKAEEFPDGIFVAGNQQVRGGSIDAYGDHRIAMAFAVAGLFADEPVTIRGADCVGISFPDFFEILQSIRQ